MSHFIDKEAGGPSIVIIISFASTLRYGEIGTGSSILHPPGRGPMITNYSDYR